MKMECFSYHKGKPNYKVFNIEYFIEHLLVEKKDDYIIYRL